MSQKQGEKALFTRNILNLGWIISKNQERMEILHQRAWKNKFFSYILIFISRYHEPKSIQHTVPNKIVLVGEIPKNKKRTLFICEEHKSTKL